MEVFVERVAAWYQFPDVRLKTRFGKLLGQLGDSIGAAMQEARQDLAKGVGDPTSRPMLLRVRREK